MVDNDAATARLDDEYPDYLGLDDTASTLPFPPWDIEDGFLSEIRAGLRSIVSSMQIDIEIPDRAQDQLLFLYSLTLHPAFWGITKPERDKILDIFDWIVDGYWADGYSKTYLPAEGLHLLPEELLRFEDFLQRLRQFILPFHSRIWSVAEKLKALRLFGRRLQKRSQETG